MVVQATASHAADDLWSKLPGDLLGEVYSRIASPRHRVLFAAVCRSWRVVSSWQPPQPAIPWLLLSSDSAKRMFCPVDGAILRAPFPSETIGSNLVGFYDGGWVAATSGDNAVSIALMNLFSGVEVPLSAKQRVHPNMIWKIVFSEAPTSKHCVLAAISNGLALCRVGCQNHSWWKSNSCHNYSDIAFCHGKLYGIYSNALFVHDIRMAKGGFPVLGTTSELCINQPPSFIAPVYSFNYIVEYKDTLLIAQRVSWISPHEFIFKLFELVKTEDNVCYDYTWAEVTTLDDHALFLSYKCSKAVHVPASARGRVEKNHIYYNYTRYLRKYESVLEDVQLTWDSVENLHCMKNKKGSGLQDRILSTGYFVTSGRQGQLWLLPPDF